MGELGGLEELVLRVARIAEADETGYPERGKPDDAEPEQRISPAESAPAPPRGRVDVSVGWRRFPWMYSHPSPSEL
jgi:hypothetical protein